MKITPAHMLDDAVSDPIAGGSPLNVRRCLVIHFTAGATAQSSIQSMRSQGLSAHLVIDRAGLIYQCRAFNRTCAHAGASRWFDPNTGIRYNGMNSYSIGIEIANAGDDPKVIAWAKKNAGAVTVRAKHRNGGGLRDWEVYPDRQIASVFDAAKVLVERYRLDDITGHDCIAPERKADPGPAFPMEDLRKHCGFKGLPVVHWK